MKTYELKWRVRAYIEAESEKEALDKGCDLPENELEWDEFEMKEV